MNTATRRLLFEPLRAGSLSAIVPDLTVSLPQGEITAPTQLTYEDERFMFRMHFVGRDIPPEFRLKGGIVYGVEDRLPIRGQIQAELPFRAKVFPPSNTTMRSRGTATVEFWADRLELCAECFDQLTGGELSEKAGYDKEEGDGVSAFQAHLIFHGPKLTFADGGTESVSKNDFLGSVTRSTLDTHTFTAADWEGALIQESEELHLHLRSRLGVQIANRSPEQVITLVRCAAQTVGISSGFHPVSCFEEIRVNHRVIERSVAPRFHLRQSYVRGVSGRASLPDAEKAPIPAITNGLASLTSEQRERVLILLWHLQGATNDSLPPSTRLLIVCAALDGLTKCFATESPDSKVDTNKAWLLAVERAGLSWDKWGSEIFKVWGKHRHNLSHGRLWRTEGEEKADTFFDDFPRLGCAFLILLAAYCGYEGPMVSDPFRSKAVRIGDVKT